MTLTEEYQAKKLLQKMKYWILIMTVMKNVDISYAKKEYKLTSACQEDDRYLL